MVGIKDFGMPKCCMNCEMLDGEYGNCDIIGDTQDLEYQWDENRPFDCPLVEAIPKDVIKEFLEKGTKDVSKNVLAIVREEYIHKSEYEARLKADMVAMLTELKKEIEGQCKIPNNCASAYDWNNGVYACYKAVQQKIDTLKEMVEDGKRG